VGGRLGHGQRPVTTALSLGHGDPLTDQGPQLRVEVRVERVDAEQVPTVSSESRRHLAEDLWLAAASQAPTPPSAGSGSSAPAAGRTRPGLRSRSRWTAGWSTSSGRGRAATGSPGPELDDRTLTLHGRDLPVESVELVRVSELEPYIQGQRRLQEAWARHDDQKH
jgi:hypothetical protein